MGGNLDKRSSFNDKIRYQTFQKGSFNEFSKQFATYWKSDSRFCTQQRPQYGMQKGYDKSIYSLDSAFSCSNQFMSPFSSPPKNSSRPAEQTSSSASGPSKLDLYRPRNGRPDLPNTSL
uniref:Uncharacterized protein n=1 Tax=Syphacia muris TaxID=451379 RepID=A0A0N5AMQ6_9BILA